jgi:hypothetical protein
MLTSVSLTVASGGTCHSSSSCTRTERGICLGAFFPARKANNGLSLTAHLTLWWTTSQQQQLQPRDTLSPPRLGTAPGLPGCCSAWNSRGKDWRSINAVVPASLASSVGRHCVFTITYSGLLSSGNVHTCSGLCVNFAKTLCEQNTRCRLSSAAALLGDVKLSDVKLYFRCNYDKFEGRVPCRPQVSHKTAELEDNGRSVCRGGGGGGGDCGLREGS